MAEKQVTHNTASNRGRIIWGLIITILVIFFVYMSLKKEVNRETVYFHDLYRINGENYYLLHSDDSKRYELWKWQDETESLVHQFPKRTRGKVEWVESQNSFFYVVKGILYQWDFASGTETKLYDVADQWIVAVLQDYILFKNQNHEYILSEMKNGTKKSTSVLTGKSMQIMDISENRMLYSLGDGVNEDEVYLYDAENNIKKLLGSQRGHILAGVITQDNILYSVSSGEVYRVDFSGKNLSSFQPSPWDNCPIRAFGKADGYVVGATKRPSYQGTGQSKIEYYQIKRDDTVVQVAEWEPVCCIFAHGFVIQCDGDLVISGSMTDEDKFQFLIP